MGRVEGLDDRWTEVVLPADYQDPVVLAGPSTALDPDPGVIELRMDPGSTKRLDLRFREWDYLDGVHQHPEGVGLTKPFASDLGQPGVLRIRDVQGNAFSIRQQKWRYLPCCSAAERVFYLVAESGSHDLGGLTVEAGKLDLNKPASLDGWASVSLSAPFPAAPAVFAATETFNGAHPVTTRVRNRDATGFDLAMQEEEGGDGGHTTETFGWVAIEEGTVQTPAGRAIEVVVTQIDEQMSTLGYAMGVYRSFPTVVADISSAYDMDVCTIRHGVVGPASIELFVQEEQSLDAEMDHDMEEVSVLVAE